MKHPKTGKFGAIKRGAHMKQASCQHMQHKLWYHVWPASTAPRGFENGMLWSSTPSSIDHVAFNGWSPWSTQNVILAAWHIKCGPNECLLHDVHITHQAVGVTEILQQMLMCLKYISQVQVAAAASWPRLLWEQFPCFESWQVAPQAFCAVELPCGQKAVLAQMVVHHNPYELHAALHADYMTPTQHGAESATTPWRIESEQQDCQLIE